jgi:hypothetical protein
MAGFKERLAERRAKRQAARDERRRTLAMDSRPGVKEAQSDEQSKLQEKFPSSGAGG